MGTTLNSLDTIIASSTTNGGWRRSVFTGTASSTTNANSTSGAVSVRRHPRTLAVPSVAGGLTGSYVTKCNMNHMNAACINMCGLEYDMGTLTVATNSFSDGVAMPTKSVRGTSITTATQYAMLVVTAAMTATTPTVTITYTDQDGNTGNTATLILPSNVTVNSAFLIHPHLASGDTGIRDITNISIDTGSAGTLKVYGLLTLGMSVPLGSSAGQEAGVPPLSSSMEMWLCESGENIGFYSFINTSGGFFAALSAVAEN